MSYDPKYREWVEKHTKKEAGQREVNEFYQTYRGVPVIRVKARDDPPLYHFLAPIVRGKTRQFERVCKKIDRQLDKPSGKRVRKRADSDDLSYFQKWQNCQVELSDMKRREANMLSKVKELQAKVDELSSTQIQQKKDLIELKKQLKASKAQISELNKKK